MNNDCRKKQVIVVRKDLNMRKGKIAAQVAHASLGCIKKILQKTEDTDINFFDTNEKIINYRLSYYEIDAFGEWFEDSWTKICASVDTETELLDIRDRCKEKNILHCLVQDAGRTEFKGIPTYTCIAVGPFWSDKIDEITGNLKLL